MSVNTKPTFLILSALSLWCAALFSAATPRVLAAPAPAFGTAESQAPQAKFVGEETCLGCHEDQRRGYHGTPHGRAADRRSPAARQGCESCHGPGSAHIEDPSANPVVRFTGGAPQQENAACTSCHNRGPHALWEGSQHESRDLSCATCHSVHAFKSDIAQLKARTEQDVCATCHRDKIAKLDRSGHMPVREGKMQCSTCHDPHGSSNERMLVSKPPILCQRCHIATRHPSTIYDAGLIGSAASPSVRIYARSCVTCHSAIHGSNHPSGQRFVR